MTDDIEHLDPAQAIALARRSRLEAAERGVSGAHWYAPLYGLCIAEMVASMALPERLMGWGMGFGIGGMVLLYAFWRERTGLSVTGFNGGARANRVTLAFALSLAVIVIAAAALRFEAAWWAPLPLAVLAGVVATVASRAWDAAWLAEMRRGL